MTGIAGEILKMVQGDGVAKLTGDLGLDGGTASSAVQATVETVLGQLGGAVVEDPRPLFHGAGLDDEVSQAGGILDALLPMILNAVKKLGSSGGGLGGALGGIGKLLG